MQSPRPSPSPDPQTGPHVGLIMGSLSDWEILHYTADQLEALSLTYEKQVVSAHRTPQRLYEYAQNAAARGLKVIIAGAGGAAHLPGMTAALTELPVLGVPMPSASLNGVDSLLSIIQMPAGVPTLTLAIGKPGAINAALSAAAILALEDEGVRARLHDFRQKQTNGVLAARFPE